MEGVFIYVEDQQAAFRSILPLPAVPTPPPAAVSTAFLSPAAASSPPPLAAAASTTLLYSAFLQVALLLSASVLVASLLSFTLSLNLRTLPTLEEPCQPWRNPLLASIAKPAGSK